MSAAGRPDEERRSAQHEGAPASAAAPAWLERAAGWACKAADTLAPQRLSILIFHRVLPRPDPLFPHAMHAARFDRLMGLVARSHSVLTLGRALEMRAAGRLPPRALAITFDDGYADNAELALPVLLRHGLQASFFVATGFLDGGRMWNDTIIETLRHTRREGIGLQDFGLGRFALTTAAERRAAIDALLPAVKHLGLAEREAALAQLRALAGAPELPEHAMMRSAQVRELHRAGMEIGGHTVNHPILAVLPDGEAEAEISDGRQRLQDIIGAPVDVFAYPNGRPGRDYDARHVAMLQRLGFRGAVSTAGGVATAASDGFQLPRFTPWDQDSARWMGRLLLQRLRGRRHAVALPAAAGVAGSG